MNTSALKSLMRLFSLTANLTSLPSLEQSGKKVRAYLSQLTNPEEASSYYNMFEFYFNQIQNPEKSFLKRYSLFSVKAIILTNELLPNLTKEQRIFALVILMEIIEQDETERSYLMDFIYTLSDILAISPHTVAQLQEFVFWHDTSTINNNLMLFASDKDHDFKGKYVPWKHVYGKIYFFSETESKTFFFKLEKFREQLSLNGKPIQENKVYFFGKGDSLRSHKFKAIQYSDVVKSYSLDSTIPVTLTAKGVKYQFPDKKTGIHPFDLEEENGQLVGILGSSGVGKTTFVNLLNGNLKPSEGSIWLNGYDIHTEKEMVKSQIGYVPQDDLLISELTVRQNLTYSARLCYGNLTSGEISRKVEDILQSLGLRHIADLAVGDALNKVISGGQRKRLNIALELLREPALLFIDEPTSGLSSSDSDMVMDLLKSLSLRGKLVFANIHQPSSGIFKMFDKIIILDKGGYMIYYGEPLEAAVFFKEHTNRTNASERECVSCGNVNPEQILQLVEQKKITPEGEISQERLLSPEGWYKNHRVYHAMRTIPEPEKTGLPTSGFSLPSAWKQFKIFTERTFLTKYQDKQYLWVSLLEAPLLALILGYFSRYVAGESGNPNQYIFFENVNLPVFFLMSVIVAL
ncbi:MAG: ATP-binding cassette domain-containing protein, partial [Bacteroidota bacterium]